MKYMELPGENTEVTFVMIKPNAMKKGKAGAIIDRFLKEGLKIVGIKMGYVSTGICEKFYKEHKEKAFFKELVEYICSYPLIFMALEGDHAVSRVREIIGDTDPAKAKKGTLRAKYGDSISENAVHGSDSEHNAGKELHFFFNPIDLYSSLEFVEVDENEEENEDEDFKL